MNTLPKFATEDEEYMDIRNILDSRKPRVKTVVLICNGKTMFVPEADIIDWEKKQKEDAICSAIAIGAASVVLVMSACLMAHIGSPRACLFTIGATLAACLAAKACRVFRVKQNKNNL